MIDGEEEVEADEAEPEVDLVEHCLVASDCSFVSEYPVGALIFEREGQATEVPIILVARIEGHFLVCVPGSCWHRLTANRLLPKSALGKFTALAIACVKEDARDSPVVDEYIKVWLGLLKPELESCIEIFRTPEENQFVTEGGESGFLPSAEALGVAAEERFAFMSAASDVGQDQTASRLSVLEQSMLAMKDSLAELVKNQKAMSQGAATSSQPVGATQGAPVASVLKARPKSQHQKLDAGVAGLDPQIVQSALTAGIDRRDLEELSRILKPGKVQKLKDLPRGSVAQKDVLGESEEEYLGQEAHPAVVNLTEAEKNDPMLAAVQKLATIADSLAGRKKARNLDELLDDSHLLQESSSSSLSGGSRRHSAILKALRRALLESPQELFACIEQKMLSDFGSREGAPGEPDRLGSFRGWLEHRSRIPNIAGTVRMSWGIAGALDSLRQGKVEETKARLGLLLAQIDQVAVDRGQWLLAAEGSLEDPPPFSAFTRHMPPEIYESQHTKLWDSRWAEALMNKIKETDEFVERRSKLGRRIPYNPNLKAAEEEGGKKGKKGKGKSPTAEEVTQ